MDDFYKSEAWQKATAAQRRNFVSKMRADARMKKELEQKLARQKKIDARPPQPSKVRKKKKAERKQNHNDSGVKQFIAKSTIDVKSDAFLDSFEWRSLRMMALKKYSPRCMCCGATPATGAVMNVDHIKPRKLFPQLALNINNLQILCHECNHGKGNWDSTDWRLL